MRHWLFLLAVIIVSTDAGACPAGRAPGGISPDPATLRNASDSRTDRVFVLIALGHCIGRVHQPLHIFFAGDRAGNGIDAGLAGRRGTSTKRL